jgi:hypothetical protein
MHYRVSWHRNRHIQSYRLNPETKKEYEYYDEIIYATD